MKKILIMAMILSPISSMASGPTLTCEEVDQSLKMQLNLAITEKKHLLTNCSFLQQQQQQHQRPNDYFTFSQCELRIFTLDQKTSTVLQLQHEFQQICQQRQQQQP